MPTGRCEIKKSLSELESRADARSVGRGTELGLDPRGVGTARSGRGSMEARDGKGLVTTESRRTAGWGWYELVRRANRRSRVGVLVPPY